MNECHESLPGGLRGRSQHLCVVSAGWGCRWHLGPSWVPSAVGSGPSLFSCLWGWPPLGPPQCPRSSLKGGLAAVWRPPAAPWLPVLARLGGAGPSTSASLPELGLAGLSEDGALS